MLRQKNMSRKEDDQVRYRRSIRTAIAALMICMCLAAAGCGRSGRIRLGTAGIGGNYHSLGQTMAQILSEEDNGVEVEVKVTAGSAANLRLISKDFLQMAIVQTDLASNAVNGTGVFKGSDPLTGFSAVAGLYTEACQIVVSADSDIQSVKDLRDRKVSIGEDESGSEQNAKEILAAYGLSAKTVDEVNLSYTDAADALRSGEIDAFFCTAGVQTTVVEELARQHDIRLIPVDGDEADVLMEEYDFYTPFTIPAGTYAGQDEDVATLGIRAMLIARDDLDSETVEKITASLYEHAGELQYSVPVDFDLTAEAGAADLPIPFHEGAAAYYEKQGISAETADQ